MVLVLYRNKKERREKRVKAVKKKDKRRERSERMMWKIRGALVVAFFARQNEKGNYHKYPYFLKKFKNTRLHKFQSNISTFNQYEQNTPMSILKTYTLFSFFLLLQPTTTVELIISHYLY